MEDFHLYLKASPFGFYTFIILVGLAIGSFLNVVIYRLPKMLMRDWKIECQELLDLPVDETNAKPFNLVSPRSSCPACNHLIRFWENIPIISYIFLRGQCSQCGCKISMRYPLVEFLTALFSVIVAYYFGVSAQLIVALLFTWALIALTFIDFDTQLLPDNITLPFLWLALLVNTNDLFCPSQTSIYGAVFGYLSLWSIYHIFKLLTKKEGMGYGDFKLNAMLGALLGWQQVPVIIILSSFLGAFLGILLIIFKKHNKEVPIPFGPFIAIAGFIAMLFGNDIIHWYLSRAM